MQLLIGEFTWLFWMLAIVGVVLTGISKSGFAGGAGVVAVPLLALVIPVAQAVALMLPLLIVMDVRTVQYYRHYIDREELKGIVPAALIGIAVAGVLLGTVPDLVLQVVLGVFCLLFAVWARLAPVLGKLPGSAWLWGGVSGFSSTLIHSGGPPLQVYLLSRGLPKLTWLATASVMFGVMNLVKIVPYSLNGQWSIQLLLVAVVLLPAAWLGVRLGHWLQGRMNDAVFSTTARVLLAISGVLLLLKAW